MSCWPLDLQMRSQVVTPQCACRKYYSLATTILWTRAALTYFFTLRALGARFAQAAVAFALAFARGLPGASPLSRGRLAAGNFGIACLAQGMCGRMMEKGHQKKKRWAATCFFDCRRTSQLSSLIRPSNSTPAMALGEQRPKRSSRLTMFF